MGVTGDLLPRILRTSGRKVDLSKYKDGIIESSSKKKDKSKRQRTLMRRPLRIALDVGTIVARAAHGLGGQLLDDRHLTNYGRSLLQEEANNNADASAVDSRQAVTSDENKREYVNRCAGYVMKRIHTLKNLSGGEILVVFDGATPPIKGEECIRRSQKRKQAAQERDEPVVADEAAGANTKRRVRAARRAGAGKNHGDILVEVMQALRKARIPFMVAPYEADGQLAYLAQKGMVDLVVTEDSDLIAHGCDSIVYKTIEGLGKGAAEGILVQRGDLGALGLVQKTLSLQDFSDVMLAVMFVALGCDYCSSLKQIGSVAARDIVRVSFHGEKEQTEEERQKPPLAKLFERLYKQTSEKDLLTDEFKKEYEASFLEALLMYRHPMVYDPFVGKCVLLRNPPHGSDPELLEYEPYARLCNDVRRREQILGTCHGPTTSTRIAEGWVNPRTKRPYENMEIPATTKEALLSLSASESEGDEERVHTQDLTSPAAAGSQGESFVQGPETQDLNHVETQLVGTPGRRQQGGSAASSPETQDMMRVESQLGSPSQRAHQTLNSESTMSFDATFQEETIGIAIGANLVVTKIIDQDLAGKSVRVGDKLVAVGGRQLEEGTVVLDVKNLIHGLPRPVTMSFTRPVTGNEDGDEISGPSPQTQQQSPLRGSSTTYDATFQEKKIGLMINSQLIVTSIFDRELAGETVEAGDKLVAINGGLVEEGALLRDVVNLIHRLPRPVMISFTREAAGNGNRDGVEVGATTQSSSSLTQQSPLTGSSSSRMDSQPSQFSAESQVSPGTHSPNLLGDSCQQS